MRIVHDGLIEPQAEGPGRGLAEVLAQARPTSPAHVTIGVFDGVHRGHQRLITCMVRAARSARQAAIAMTFDPHPVATLGHAPPPLLTTMEERAELLAALGLDIMIVLPFTPATARTPATDFVEALMHHLNLTALWGGPDFTIGHRREGNVSFLRRLGAERGFTVHTVEPLAWGGALVSSSRVRAALQVGDIPQAIGCLGRPYRLSGIVAPPQPHPPGRAGRTLEGRAFDLCPPPERLIPACGVYAGIAHTGHLGARPAVINISPSPTAGGDLDRPRPAVEVRLFDLDADLYGQVLALDFTARLVADPLQSLDLEGISQERQQYG